MTAAHAYVAICLGAAIPLAQSPEELRQWWKAETRNRFKYKLAVRQVDELIEACRIRTIELKRGE